MVSKLILRKSRLLVQEASVGSTIFQFVTHEFMSCYIIHYIIKILIIILNKMRLLIWYKVVYANTNNIFLLLFMLLWSTSVKSQKLLQLFDFSILQIFFWIFWIPINKIKICPMQLVIEEGFHLVEGRILERWNKGVWNLWWWEGLWLGEFQ